MQRDYRKDTVCCARKRDFSYCCYDVIFLQPMSFFEAKIRCPKMDYFTTFLVLFLSSVRQRKNLKKRMKILCCFFLPEPVITTGTFIKNPNTNEVKKGVTCPLICTQQS